MNIAYICTSLSWGGLEMNQVKNALAMRERGHNTVVFGVKDSPYYKRAIELELPVYPIKYHHKYFHLKAAFDLAQSLKKKNIENVIIRDNRDVGVCASAKRFFNKKLNLFYFMEMQLTRNKKSWFHTRRYKKLKAWNCPLPYMKEQVVSHADYPEEKITLIPSGIDLNDFRQLPDKKEARETLNLPQEPFVFGILGRLDPQKGQMLALDAFVQLQKNEAANISLLFMGDATSGEYEDYAQTLKQKAKENKIEHLVFFRPYSPDIKSFYAASDVVLMTSYNETFGMVTLEALAAGKIVVGSDSGGTKDLLQNGKSGLLFKSRNIQDLTLKMKESLHLKPSETNFQSDLKKFDFDTVLEQVEELINSSN